MNLLNIYFFTIFTSTSPDPSSSTLTLSFPDRFVLMTPALSPATITSYSESSAAPTVICASWLPSTVKDMPLSLSQKSWTEVPGTDSYKNKPFFSSFVIA